MAIKVETGVSRICFGSLDYQEKVFSTTLVREHLFLIIFWAEIYMTIYRIRPHPKNRVSRTWREVITALERKGSEVWSAGRGGWSCEAWVAGMSQRVTQTSRAPGAKQVGGGVAMCKIMLAGDQCKGWHLGGDWCEQDLILDLQCCRCIFCCCCGILW